MKHLFLLIFSCFTYSLISTAQNDSPLYYNKDWKATSKDSAYYYSTFSYSDGLYKKIDYYSKTNTPQMVGSYLDKKMKTGEGFFKWYYENGALRDSVLYKSGKRIAGSYFYEDGNKKAVFTLVDGKTVAQGWDEKGEQIPNYVFEKEAEFPGGKIGWRTYLEKNLDANTAQRARAPIGNYTVKVSFTIDKTGAIGDLKILSFPEACKLCAVEAIRVIQTGPNWVPAVQFGKPVIYQAIQYVTFQVAGN